ncbi:hypothetical protein [Saccharibacillus qingshengii]|uniref:hypothetical protein n=1 Tax=Saccharibacillus qingshengii TaxID=1763540 RepID=UPI0015557A51|nr:hypothetical protein [Saccharibacillus qingshengii]
MNKSVVFLFLLAVSVVLPGCTSDVVDTPIYEGKPITVGIIGDSPVVREKNVSFEEIPFSQLEEVDSSSGYDAIFITKENLSEAADPVYAKTYKNAGVPFFFIESKKSYLPFINEEKGYDEIPDIQNGTYVTGYLQKDKQFQYWGYGLSNDKLNISNIEDVYSRVFETIDQVETEKN